MSRRSQSTCSLLGMKAFESLRICVVSLFWAKSIAIPNPPQYEAILSANRSLSNTTTFNPFAKNNIAVYYAHTPDDNGVNLITLCKVSSIDIVILGFVRQFNGLNALPKFDLTPTCNSTPLAPSSFCSPLAGQISLCQSLGVKIFLSIGGSVSNTTFSSASEASDAAMTLWNVFGAGNYTPSLRPFGSVVVDGFDIGKLRAVRTLNRRFLSRHQITSRVLETITGHLQARCPTYLLQSVKSISFRPLLYVPIELRFFRNPSTHTWTLSGCDSTTLNHATSALVASCRVCLAGHEI